jgi:hypothetical protein
MMEPNRWEGVPPERLRYTRRVRGTRRERARLKRNYEQHCGGTLQLTCAARGFGEGGSRTSTYSKIQTPSSNAKAPRKTCIRDFNTVTIGGNAGAQMEPPRRGHECDADAISRFQNEDLVVAFVSAAGLWLTRRLRTRVRFDLVLDGTLFRVERIVGNACEPIGQLQVGEGADISVRAMRYDAVLDGFVCVRNQHGEIAFQPGGHTGEVALEVIDFLRANGIKARDRLPRGPVDMGPASMGPMG